MRYFWELGLQRLIKKNEDGLGEGYDIYRKHLYDEPPIPWQNGAGHYKLPLICDSERIFRFGSCCKRNFAAKRKIAVNKTVCVANCSSKQRHYFGVALKLHQQKKRLAALIFRLAIFCVFLSGCRVSVSTDRAAKDVEAQFHFLKVKKAGVWQDISNESLFQYGAGSDGRMRENSDKSFVFTLDKNTPPETITNYFFSTSLGTDLLGVEASIVFLSGLPGICGIYFPATPDANAENQEYYFFGVDKIGQFALYYRPPSGDISAIVRPEQHECIRKGWDAKNILKAYADGNNLVFQINGETVHTEKNAKLTEGRTGIFVRTRAKTDD